jgi:hypothetical protein
MNGGCERLERDQYSTEACFSETLLNRSFVPFLPLKHRRRRQSFDETICWFISTKKNQSGFDFDATVVRKHVIKRSNPEMEESPLTNRDVF